MKKIITIALVIFGITFSAILVGGLVFNQTSFKSLITSHNNNSVKQISDKNQAFSDKNQTLSIATSTEKNSSNQTINPLPTLKQKSIFSAAEVAKHNSQDDCWLIIQNKVYDVSDYLNYHPGNPETILPYCGRDATQAFNTKDKPKPKLHSPKAQEILKQYYLGDFSGN